ncbi:hypothetical protein ACOJVU_19760 [Mycobacterium sp. THU-M104]|uniref:hypothetical protein n=1 Tax=Mycobacterium sp. THU-M104 TaxID=3410515 RepID=UPI003B9CC290
MAINALGWRQLEAMSGLATQGLAGTKVRQLAGPEQRAYQTAKLLGLQAATEPRLADLDCGCGAARRFGMSAPPTWSSGSPNRPARRTGASRSSS